MTPAQLALGFGYDRADTEEPERLGLPDDDLGWSFTGRTARPAPPPPPPSVSAAADRVAARRRLDATSVWVEPQTAILPRLDPAPAAPTVIMPGVLLPAPVEMPSPGRHRASGRWWWRSAGSHRRTRGGDV